MSAPNTLIDHAGDRFGRLVVIARAANKGPQAAWSAVCDCGQSVTVRGCDLRSGRTQSCGCLANELTSMRSSERRHEAVTYSRAHARLTQDRGPAKDHACVDCGQEARDWSYDGTDPEQRISEAAGSLGMPYSLDQSRYAPRCRPCHNKLDGKVVGQRRAS